MPKKILFTVTDFYPHAGGSGEVVYRLAKRFARASYEVTVATGKRAGSCWKADFQVCRFGIAGNRAKGYRGRGAEIQRYLDFVTRGDFAVIVNYAAQTWHADLLMENINKMPLSAQKILVPCGYSALALHDPRYFFYFRHLPKALAHYDQLIYLSQDYLDIRFHRCYQKKYHLPPPVIIPNGADEEEFLAGATGNKGRGQGAGAIKRKYRIETPYLAVCVANFFFLKGQDFVVRAFNQLRRQDVTLVLIGKRKNSNYFRWLRFLARGNRKILFLTDLARREVVRFFQAADFFLFGSRVECSPLVMFESFASRTLFITRGVGNTAEYAAYNVLVDSPAQMADAIERAIEDRGFYQSKVGLAFQKYLRDHTYKTIFKKYQKLMES